MNIADNEIKQGLKKIVFPLNFECYAIGIEQRCISPKSGQNLASLS